METENVNVKNWKSLIKPAKLDVKMSSDLTQAKIIAGSMNIPHLSTGDMLREAVELETKTGKLAAEVMEKGDLVSDEIVVGIIKERISRRDCNKKPIQSKKSITKKNDYFRYQRAIERGEVV